MVSRDMLQNMDSALFAKMSALVSEISVWILIPFGYILQDLLIIVVCIKDVNRILEEFQRQLLSGAN